MALWYDSKKHEYASDGKNGWIKKYCDTLVAELHEICEAHFAGIANRHKAADVDYDDRRTETVKDKLDALGNNESKLAEKLEEERVTRIEWDMALLKHIEREAENRTNGDAEKADKVTNGGFAAGEYEISGLGGITIGSGSETGQSAVALGEDTHASGYADIAIGEYAESLGSRGVAIGLSSTVLNEKGVALGANAKSSAENAFQLGDGTNNNKNTLQFYNYQVTACDDDGTKYLNDVGKLSSLKTANKTSIAAAMNELYDMIRNIKVQM